MRPDKQFNVRSVALRGENDETLEVCIDQSALSMRLTDQSQVCIAAEEADLQEADCGACPPACSDPHCVACLQKCPHTATSGYNNTVSGFIIIPFPHSDYPPKYQTRRGPHVVKHNKYLLSCIHI